MNLPEQLYSVNLNQIQIMTWSDNNPFYNMFEFIHRRIMDYDLYILILLKKMFSQLNHTDHDYFPTLKTYRNYTVQ